MTYALASGLQAAIYGRLTSDPALDGVAVFDAVPQAAPSLFVALGHEDAVARLDASGAGARHDLRLSVVTTRDGFASVKEVAALVCDSLVGASLAMTRGRVVSLRFLKAKARRDEGEGTRRIDLWFRARTDETN